MSPTIATVTAAMMTMLRECKEEDRLRQAVCERLGDAAYSPVVDPAHFDSAIDNPYFPLLPGTTFVSEGQTVEGFEHVEFAVTHHTRVILGVTCIEVVGGGPETRTPREGEFPCADLVRSRAS